MFVNVGFRATLSSPWTSLIPIVRYLYQKSSLLVWKTVKYLENLSDSICQKKDLKSSLCFISWITMH